MTKITIQEVKEALKDQDFRKSLPDILQEDVRKYENNPTCPCNLAVYKNIIKYGSKQLKDFYPEGEVSEDPPLQENNWMVINCSITELEGRLRDLGPGRMSLAVARWEDQATVIVNYLDLQS